MYIHRPSYTKTGNYWVLLEYVEENGQRKYTQFKVPSGKNIFSQVQDKDPGFEIDNVLSTMGGWKSSHTSATFCHACVKNGFKWGDTCWGITPVTDTKRGCGCNSGSWQGEGIYYGGYKSPNACGGQGGGFAGYKGNGHAKGNLNSIGLTLSVSSTGFEECTLNQ